jgi:hypothetical protein
MRSLFALLADRPDSVNVTNLRTWVNKRQPQTAQTYNNTSRMTNTAQVNLGHDVGTAVVGMNSKRCQLILQNNSTASNVNDVAPDMYFGFGCTPIVGQDLKLKPGQGLVLDMPGCSTDAIYVATGPITNGFGSVIVAGLIKEASITDSVNDTANFSSSVQLAQIIALLQQLVNGKAA